MKNFNDFLNEASGDHSSEEQAILSGIGNALPKIIQDETGLKLLVKFVKDGNEEKGIFACNVIDAEGDKRKLKITVKVELS